PFCNVTADIRSNSQTGWLVMKSALGAATALALMAGLPASPAGALVIGPAPIGSAARDAIGLEQVQYVWQGQSYCWYPDGWRCPGWYWCGYRLRRGFGWGGPQGWNGWRFGAPSRFGFRHDGVGRRFEGGRLGGRVGTTVAPGGGGRPSAMRPGVTT